MKKYKIYNFEYFDLELIEELYGKGRKYGLGKFLSKLYKRTIIFKDVDEDVIEVDVDIDVVKRPTEFKLIR